MLQRCGWTRTLLVLLSLWTADSLSVSSWSGLVAAVSSADSGGLSITVTAHLLSDGTTAAVPAGAVLTLSGAGCPATSSQPAGLCVLDARGLGNLLAVGDSAVLNVLDLAFVNGVAAVNGGAVVAGNNATLSFQKVSFLNNSSPNGGGGAVYLGGGALQVTDCVARSNVAYSYGGFATCLVTCGANACCTFNATNSVFDDNSAGKSGGGLNNYGPINVAGCTMRRNGAPSWGGGSICAYGSVTVSDSLLLDNNSKGGGSWGGAININGNLALTNVTLDGNAADGSGGAVYLGTFAQSGGPVGLPSTLRVRGLVLSHSAGASGGLYADSGVTVDIAGATFVANAAAGDGAALIVQGGGVYSRILDSSFVGNTASGGRGGALWLGDSGSHSLQRVVFASNAAGISGGALFSASGRMAVSDSSFTSNSVGGMYCRGGAMSIESLTGGDTVFTNTTFASNSNLAPLLPASVLDSAFSLVYAAGDALFDAPPGAGASFGQGKARIVSRPPCHRCAEPVSCQAGALFVACAFAAPSPLSLSLNGCSFSANTALYGGALAVPASGAVALSIDGGAFSTNSAGVDGGALWLAGGATVASRTTFVNNTALAGDGGVAHASGSATRVALSSVGAASNAAPAGRGGVLALRAGAAATSAGGAWGANAAFGGGCVYVATNDSPPPFAALSGTSLSGNAATAGGVWLVDAPPPGANTSVLAPPVCAPSACAFEGAANAAPLGPLFATLPCAAAVAAPPWVHSGAALAANVSLLDAFGQSASSWPTLLVTASCASPCAQPTLGGLTTAPFVPSPPPAASSAAGSRLPGVASFPLLTLFGSVNASVAVAFRLSSPSLGAFDGASVVAFISVSPCNAATESFDPASLRCVCSPGASSSTGACDLCPPGRVSPSAGAALCAPCPSNTFASPNRTQCTPCPASSLAPPGTAGVGGCVCPFSTYAVPAVPSEPFSGWFACSPCPPGALCVGTGGPPLATAGFWHPPGGARSMFYDCSAGLCLAEDPLAPLSPDNASTCAPGQAGPVCGVCLPDYALQGGGGCAPCPAGGALTAWPAPARAAVAVAAALAFVAASLPPLLAPLFPEKVSRALDSLSRLFRRWRWGDRAAQTTENDDADMEPVSPRGVAAAFSPRGGGATPNAPAWRPSFSSTPRPKPDPPPPSQWGDVALTPAPRSFGASLSLRQRRPSSGGDPAVVPPPLHPGSPRASSVLLHAAAAAEGGAAAPLAAIPSTRLSFIEDGPAAAAKAAGGGEAEERSALVADGARGWVVPFFVAAVAFCSEPLRVVTTCVQIVSSFQRTMRIPWPRVYYDVSSRLSFLDLNFMRLPRAACAAPSSNFYATFNGTTLGVTALLAYVATCWAAGDAYARREGLSPATRSSFAHATLAKALLVLDVAFAPLSQTILAVFSCRSIGNESFLRADLSLQCGTPRHAFYTRLAMFWLIVYPLGTPILYVCLLCYYRIPSAARRLRDVAGLRAVVDEAWLRGIPQPEGVNTSLLTPDNIGDDHIDALLHGLRGGGSRCGALLSRDAKLQALLAWARKHTSRTHYTWDAAAKSVGTDARRPGADRAIGLLFLPYLPVRFFYKLVEISFKLVITSLLGFVNVGSDGQVVAGLLLSLAKTLLFLRLLPHAEKATRRVAYACSLVVTLFFLLALLLETGAAVTRDDDAFYGAWAGVLSCATFAVPFYIVVTSGRLQHLWHSAKLAQ